MGDIRDRIAAVLGSHDAYDYAGGLECRCGSFRDGCGGTATGGWYRHLADTVIEALGLRQEWRADLGYDGYSNCDDVDEATELVNDWNHALGADIRDGEQAIALHRYVTDWTADE